MPVGFIVLLGDLLRYAKYAIKIANGKSKETHSHSTTPPVYGLGQSSTVSATGWGKLFSKTLDLLNK